MQLGFLHMTLANSPVSYGVPMYQVHLPRQLPHHGPADDPRLLSPVRARGAQTLLTVLSIIAGGIYFSEFRHMAPVPFLIFVGGVGISLFGVVLHSTHRHYLESQPLAPEARCAPAMPTTPSLTPPETYSPAMGAAAGPHASRGRRAGPNETTKLPPRSVEP